MEVIAAGCIPVVVQHAWTVLPLHHVIDWTGCACLLQISDLTESLGALPRDRTVQDAMRHRLAAVYHEFLATRELQVRAVLECLERAASSRVERASREVSE